MNIHQMTTSIRAARSRMRAGFDELLDHYASLRPGDEIASETVAEKTEALATAFTEAAEALEQLAEELRASPGTTESLTN